MTSARRGVRVNTSLTIPEDEIEWQFSASGGPGGQHANTANTRAELTYDIETSRVLGPRQRARLLDRFGPRLRVVASDERSQLRNRELALERLAERLRDGLKVRAPRRATSPSKASKERRLQEKRGRAEVKRQRQRPGAD